MKSTIDFLHTTELQESNPVHANVFRNIQGNILKGHGRDNAVLIFLRFRDRLNNIPARALLGKLAAEHVTSFYMQLWERERFKRNGIPGGTFGTLLITHAGYDFLEPNDMRLKDEAFKAGLKARHKKLNDPQKDVEGWHNGHIDALLLLADDDKRRLTEKVAAALKDCEVPAVVVHIEYGDAIRNSNGDGLEHNGYVDGVSQPLFLKDEIDNYKKFHNIRNDGQEIDDKDGNEMKFDPAALPELVLIEDPYAPQGEDNYGSYFVFRKLEQYVRAFKDQEKNIGKAMYKDEELGERVGARLVGRFEDGTPIQVQDEEKLIGSGVFNNFNYKLEDGQPDISKCPYFAHIRKVNERKNKKFDEHAIARRGIPFGYRNVSTEIDDIQTLQFPVKGVGLLFMCYQRSITDQFEFLQENANDSKNGVDPVIGQGDRKAGYIFPDDGDLRPGADRTHSFGQHTTFRGGEYFFAPSMAYLASLG